MKHGKKKILLCDTTLRDGAQDPDIHLSYPERLKLAEKLLDAGIDELEAGIPAMGKEAVSFINQLTAQYPNKNISCWCRCSIADIESAALSGADIVHISVLASPILLSSMDRTWHETFKLLPEVISRAAELFSKVSIGIPDTFRTPIDRIERILLLADKMRLYRVRIADTVGTAIPSEVAKLFLLLSGKYSTPLVFHGHNDLGLATANSIAAAESGASWIDVTLGGIGERAGNTRLEEIAAALKLSENFTTGFDLTKIQHLASLLAEMTERPIPINQPITGKNILTHSSGIHCKSVIKEEMSFQPFPPSFVGLDHNNLVAGSHSGKNGMKYMLESMGIDIDSASFDRFTDTIKQKSIQFKKSYSKHELANEYNLFHRTPSCS